MVTSKGHKQFSPLKDSDSPSSKETLKLKGIIFDMDGTLCLPQTYMFDQMRSALGISKTVDILNHCYSLPPSQQQEALQKIRNIETIAMTSQTPQVGLQQLMKYLEDRGIAKAICTRNFDAPVTHLLHKFLPGITFNPIVTRSFQPPKPSPAGILHIAKTWGLTTTDDSGKIIGDASNLIMVGDSIDDLTAGYRAGAATVLLASDVNTHLKSHEHCDFVIESLDQLIEVIENGFTSRIRREVD